MSGWRLVLFASRDAAFAAGVAAGFNGAQPGACWPNPRLLQERDEALAQRYLQHAAAERPPIFIALPGGGAWSPDCRAFTAGDGYHGEGWDVIGEWPNVTITPSINAVGSYHGWVRDGVLTEDCEGRTFPTLHRTA